MKEETRPRLLWGMLLAALVIVFGISARNWLQPKAVPLPVLATVPDFSFTERSGEPFGLQQLRGHIWLADFIFTNCAGTCPIMTTQMNELQSAFAEANLEVRLVSFTVDPERDTPEVLRRFAEGYGAERDKWFFITGPGEQMQKLAKEGFMLAAATGGDADEAIIHSNRFVLVDRAGRIRKYYDGTAEGINQEILQ
ncbi:MAG: SCO family protein, partial [candidate division KSB1 bacterium]